MYLLFVFYIYVNNVNQFEYRNNNGRLINQNTSSIFFSLLKHKPTMNIEYNIIYIISIKNSKNMGGTKYYYNNHFSWHNYALYPIINTQIHNAATPSVIFCLS